MNLEQQPLINWDELYAIARKNMQPMEKKEDMNIWDNASKMYKQMAKMEAKYTVKQIDAMPLLSTDDVLDCGCGPGRITVPIAKRVQSVTAMDSSKLMLNACKQNVNEANLTNVDFKFLDFHTINIEKDLKKFDVVICSRSEGHSDLARLSSMSKKYVVIITWANSPTIPHILSELFKGAKEDSKAMPPSDRRMGYNLLVNKVYDLGYEPNVSIVEDGFEETFESKDEAYETLSNLREFDKEKIDIFKTNVDKYLTQNSDGSFTFLAKTRSAVIWWDVNKVNWNEWN